MNKRYLAIIIASVQCIGMSANAEVEPWTFVSSPDWHCSEASLKTPISPAIVEGQEQVLNDMASHHPQMALFAGDLLGGHWIGKKYIDKYAPGGTQREAIINIGTICYSDFKARFNEKGIQPVIVAVGDHEIGDNDWGWKPKAQAIPWFREAFAKNFTQYPSGRWIFNEPISDVPSRPIGTPYEGTSYAYLHKNLLVVTVDVFHSGNLEEMRKRKGNRGAVVIDVEGAHLEWLDSILTAAEKDPRIRHIIVQAHCPVLPPVQRAQSSGAHVNQYGDSNFWKVLRTHKVDLYFAGEVHMTTAAKDPKSDIVHLVHGAMASTSNLAYLVGTVHEDRLDLEARWRSETNPTQFETAGRMTIDKTSPKTKITASGVLSLVNQDDLIVHYPFEGICDGQVVNTGSFSERFYSASATNVQIVPAGRVGQALSLSGNGLVVSRGWSPVYGNIPRTVSTWIQTTSQQPLGITGFVTDYYKQKKKPNLTQFNLILEEGILKVQNGKEEYVSVADKESKLNDGKWHHVAVVVPQTDAVLKDIELYVDGQKQATTVSKPDSRIKTGIFNLAVGMTCLPGEQKRFFNGRIDDYGLWFRDLTQAQIQLLYKAAVHPELQMNASDVESLFDLYYAKQGQVQIGQNMWKYVEQLTGAPGNIVPQKGHCSVALDSQGNGLITVK